MRRAISRRTLVELDRALAALAGDAPQFATRIGEIRALITPYVHPGAAHPNEPDRRAGETEPGSAPSARGPLGGVGHGREADVNHFSIADDELARKVLGMIRDHETGIVGMKPTERHLAKVLRVPRLTIIYVLERLEAEGRIKRSGRGRGAKITIIQPAGEPA